MLHLCVRCLCDFGILSLLIGYGTMLWKKPDDRRLRFRKVVFVMVAAAVVLGVVWHEHQRETEAEQERADRRAVLEVIQSWHELQTIQAKEKDR